MKRHSVSGISSESEELRVLEKTIVVMPPWCETEVSKMSWLTSTVGSSLTVAVGLKYLTNNVNVKSN